MSDPHPVDYATELELENERLKERNLRLQAMLRHPSSGARLAGLL